MRSFKSFGRGRCRLVSGRLNILNVNPNYLRGWLLLDWCRSKYEQEIEWEWLSEDKLSPRLQKALAQCRADGVLNSQPW
jgi:hypothetical protein